MRVSRQLLLRVQQLRSELRAGTRPFSGGPHGANQVRPAELRLFDRQVVVSREAIAHYDLPKVLKTSFSGSIHTFNLVKYASRYLGGYCFRFNRRVSLAEMTEQIANAVCCCMP